MTAPDPRLEEIEGRLSKATPGPWFLNDCEGEVVILPESDLVNVQRYEDGSMSWGLPTHYPPERRILEVELDSWDEGEDEQDDQIRSNAEFIAAAPADVAYLLAELRKAQDALARVEGLAEAWRYKGEFGWGGWREGHGPGPEGYVLDMCAGELRAAVADATGGGE